MTIYRSNAVLEQNYSNSETQPNSLSLANDVKRGYSKTPTAHVRDMVADGIKGNGLAVYFAIADRQVTSKGEYFRSNESLAEETGLKVRTVQNWISRLRKKQYLAVWYINGGRRMRISTKVQAVAPQHATSDTPTCNQLHPYKENNIKKTTQQKKAAPLGDVSSISLSEENRVLFGEGSLNRLVASFGKRRVQQGLLAWDAEDQSTIRNPMGWLSDAVKNNYKPRTAASLGQQFPNEDVFEHDRIIRQYMKKGSKNVDTVNGLVEQGIEEGRIAYKIWVGKI